MVLIFLALNTPLTVLLHWRRRAEWAASGAPASVTIEFREVSEFRFQPRDPALPFDEDDCVRSFGYCTDWSEGGVIITDIAEPAQTPDPKWLTAVDFMSGAVIAVQAASAHARIAS
jgi:hypothetical protein